MSSNENRILGRIPKECLGEYYDVVSTTEVILTHPVIKHILENHPNDFLKLMAELPETILNPQFVFEDLKQCDILLFVRELVADNQKAIIRLNTTNDPFHPLNSVISSYIINTDRDLEN